MNEAQFRLLISGKTRGFGALCCRFGLQLLTPFYWLAICARNLVYHFGLKRIHRAAAPVVSIGNLTTGGTGKTPIAAFVAQQLSAKNIRAAFLSRGYKGEPGWVNDEALVLKLLCPDVPHVQNPDRVAGADHAVGKHGGELLILDDGFQHRRLHRDFDIVLIDALNPWGYGHLLPRGLLREPLSSLRRADIVIITRADQAASDALSDIRAQIARRTNAPQAEIAFQPRRLVNAHGESAELETLGGKPVAAFCGIGNPDAFKETLTGLGMVVNGMRTFADHHLYTGDDLKELAGWIPSLSVDAVLVTQKDLVKLGTDALGGSPLWAVEIAAVVTAGEERWQTAMGRIAGLETVQE